MTKYFGHTVNSEKLQKYYTVIKWQFQLEYSTEISSMTIQNNDVLRTLDFLSDKSLSSSTYQLNYDIPK